MPTRTAFMIGWLVLFGAAFALFLLVALLAWWQRRRGRPGRAQRAAERAAWAEHREAVDQRAGQAAERAGAVQAQLAAAEAAAAQAWQELEQAQHAYEQADQAYAAASQRSAQRPTDPDGQRVVANAALAAYRRGDLSQDELQRVLRWGSGWDPELAQRERELRQARAARQEAHWRWRAATAAERAATQAAAVAKAEARALAEEAALAAAHLGDLAR